MESYLSTIIRNHEYGALMEEIEWLNVQNVEPKSQDQRRLGRWLGAQTNQENGCNWK
jgi:hypothetical protein